MDFQGLWSSKSRPSLAIPALIIVVLAAAAALRPAAPRAITAPILGDLVRPDPPRWGASVKRVDTPLAKGGPDVSRPLLGWSETLPLSP